MSKDRHLWVVMARIQLNDNGSWTPGIAVGKTQGLYDIEHFILFDGSIVHNVWDYELDHYKGCITFRDQD